MRRLLSTLCATAALLAATGGTAYAGYFQGTWNTSPLLPATASASAHADSSNGGNGFGTGSDQREASKNWVWVSGSPGDNPPPNAVIAASSLYTGGFLNVAVSNSSMPSAGGAQIGLGRSMSINGVYDPLANNSSGLSQTGDGAKGLVTLGGYLVTQSNSSMSFYGFASATAKWSITMYATASTGSPTLGEASGSASSHSVNPPILTCNGHE